jgi:hypothetical protein
MTDLLYMEISGVEFVISSSILTILQELEPAYRPFLNKGNDYPGLKLADIEIHIRLGEIPSTENLEKIFSSNQLWSMFKDDDNYCLTLNPPAFKVPFWLARINCDLSEITVFLNEKLVSQRNDWMVLSNPVSYPLDQILLMYILAQRNGALIHAAGIDVNGKGYVFPGRSGAGKSTLTQQFFDVADIGFLSDDRIVARKIDGGFKAYGTPWPGEAGIAENKSVPLSCIFFINHGSSNRIKEITPSEAIKRLLPVTSIPWYDREVMPKVLTFCEDLILNVPTYELSFKPTVEVVDLFKKFVSSI